MRALLTALITAYLAISMPLIAVTILVPGDYPRIQQAIDAAGDYDTVLVAPGTYVENVEIMDKIVALISEDGPNATVIDGNQQGSVVMFVNSLGPEALIEGFTVTNGNGTWVGSPYLDYVGGGIYSYYSLPTIRNNIITGNRVDQFPDGCGGGIGCHYLNNPVIEGNIIENNEANRGGGIYYGESIYPTYITIANNTIRENNTYTTTVGPGMGGGICMEKVIPFITNNDILDNDGDWHGVGGGICCSEVNQGIISGNRVAGNMARGIALFYSTLPVINNIIENNEDLWLRGGGIYCCYSDAHIVNNTVVENRCKYSGGGIYCRESSPTITNSIFWNNTSSTNGHQIGLEYNSTLTVGYSDVKDGASGVWVEPGSTLNWGTGNLDSNPLFVDPSIQDYHILYTSPCRDSGDNSAVTEPFDFEGDSRIAWGGTVDMGADEFCTHLYVTGDTTPNGAIQGKLVGLPGTNPVGLFVGTGVLPVPAGTIWGKFWLQSPWILFGPLGAIPSDGVMWLPTTLPGSIPAPYDVPMQALIGLNADSLSNPFVLQVR